MLRKAVLVLLVCLVSAIAGCASYSYLRINNLENRIDFLDNVNEKSTVELSKLSDLSSSSLEIVGDPVWITPLNYSCTGVRLVVKNNGTSVFSIVGILVNGTFVDLSSTHSQLARAHAPDTNVPLLLFPSAETTLTVTNDNYNFISGEKYQFSVVALIGASSSNCTYEATFPAPELEFYTWWGNPAEVLILDLRNIGKSAVTINEIWIDRQYKLDISETIAVGEQKTIRVQYDWKSGYTHRIHVVTSKGDEYGSMITGN